MSTDSKPRYDAIVVGSGMSGGWAAKELAERGLRTLLIERGRNVVHGKDYVTEFPDPWEFASRGVVNEEREERDYYQQKECYAFNEQTRHFFVNDRENPYSYPEGKSFEWIRAYQLGGRSLLWARQSYRLSDLDFAANKNDGYGVDWPIRYDDLAPWYDHAETFAGISGSIENIPQLPDGKFLPPMEMTCVEKVVKERIEKAFPDRKMIIGRTAHLTEPQPVHTALGRGKCQNRSQCQRGCSFGAYFSSLSATLPAARRTGNLETVTDMIVETVSFDPEKGRATGVHALDAKTREARTYKADMIFLCASTLGTTQIMLNSRSESFPNGIANSSGALGRYLMDHVMGSGAEGNFAGYEDQYYSGRRPNGIYIPRFRNVGSEYPNFLRGYGYQGGAFRESWERGKNSAGVGLELKAELRNPGPWKFGINGFGEMLPRYENKVELDTDNRDAWNMPTLRIDVTVSDNEIRMMEDAAATAKKMLEVAGLKNVEPYYTEPRPGLTIHEMGTARMGRDPKTSVLNANNQCHDVPNLFVTDGSAMTSSACQNPSLTYMALTARAANYAADAHKKGAL